MATWTILWWRLRFDLFEKSRPHRRHGNFFVCCIGCLVEIGSCSSIVLFDEDDLNICWCCWASKAAWCGFETMAIKAPVVGSMKGGVVAAAAAAAEDVGKAKDLYAEVNDKLAKSLLWPLIPVENILDRWCFDDEEEEESNRKFGECLAIGWEIGESKEITFKDKMV